ncbi:MAG TPA: septal ring lytic transglycosylase RlpA family protein, partial [Candidatus Marinimicrobia bacterium]|nr:septal ring lytic transglycosylase RlpA family protein [Candidatus Neomarinimicrobiota bacterium]
TAAHKTLPFNTLIRVTNLDNKKSIALRVNDRGPYAKGRILDCSYGAAVKLGFVGHGTARVKIEVMELGDNQYMKRKDK